MRTTHQAEPELFPIGVGSGLYSFDVPAVVIVQ